MYPQRCAIKCRQRRAIGSASIILINVSFFFLTGSGGINVGFSQTIIIGIVVVDDASVELLAWYGHHWHEL